MGINKAYQNKKKNLHEDMTTENSCFSMWTFKVDASGKTGKKSSAWTMETAELLNMAYMFDTTQYVEVKSRFF